MCPLHEVIRQESYTSKLSDISSSRPYPTINVEFHKHTSLETIIYYVKFNILPFAEKKKTLIAECKDNAYLYKEAPMNKLLKFNVCHARLIIEVLMLS